MDALQLVSRGRLFQKVWRQRIGIWLGGVVVWGMTGAAVAADFYVAPWGTNRGDGSISNPWNLGYALKGPPAVQPGDTIWMLGGVYRANGRPTKFYSSLQGAPNRPITVRQYPGERAIIDGSLSQLTGSWVNYRGFEIMNSMKRRNTLETGPFPRAFWGSDGRGNTTDFAVPGFDLRARRVKLINLIIHDSIGGGILLTTNALNPELYGNIVYHNGWQGGDRGHGHGLYAQNNAPSVAEVRDNLFFSNYALGAQATGTGSLVDNFNIRGNVFFFNSNISREHQGTLVLGPFGGNARNITLARNYFYETQPSGTDVNIGYVGGIVDGLVQENYFATRVSFSPNNQNVEVLNNTTVDALDSGKESNVVVVRPNKYEPGRAHVIVYNWQRLPEVAVDLSNVLVPGTAFEIRSAQNILGPPVVEGEYAGGTVLLPMHGLHVARPLMANATPATAPRFNVFVVMPRMPPVTQNTPPVLSSIPNQTIEKNSESKAIPFEVMDAELPPEFLNLSVNSSNPALVPNQNIQFTGARNARTLKIVPRENRVGKTSITLTLSDGRLSTTVAFNVTVRESR